MSPVCGNTDAGTQALVRHLNLLRQRDCAVAGIYVLYLTRTQNFTTTAAPLLQHRPASPRCPPRQSLTLPAAAVTNSACVPCLWGPMAAQTSSPGLNRLTPPPTATTSPDTSRPSVRGNSSEPPSRRSRFTAELPYPPAETRTERSEVSGGGDDAELRLGVKVIRVRACGSKWVHLEV